MLVDNLKPENLGETLFKFKKMFVLITEVALILLVTNGYKSITDDIIAREEERQIPVAKLTFITYSAYFLATFMVLWAYGRCNTQSTSDLDSENVIKDQEICNPD
ncbi:uncharacterized protein LOC130666476 [Microplitis mediator]|uniref:uncharacterized protein LOC130666476 n=1 Tax=Microplitis mediator TaxID=375433 RepID=UPI00255460A8|nr:uncharacterized protein LOC130666476 [Microplitis mediator]